MEARFSVLYDPDSPNQEFARKVFDAITYLNEDKPNYFELNRVEIKQFRDGEIKPTIRLNVRGKECFFIHDSSKNPDRWFLELALVNQALKKSSAKQVIDVIPYLRFARQDRKDEPRVPISARVVARTIDDYADGVLTLDVHNPSIDGFFEKRFDNLYSFKTVVSYLNKKHPKILENVVVMSPDAGGTDRANAFARMIGDTEIAVGYKKRITAGEVESLKILGDVRGKNVICIDDIVDSGNTLIKASKAAREQGAKNVYAYCTHGLFTEGMNKVLENFELFFVGDTLLQKNHPQLEVISFAPLFAEAIYRISKGESLSALFKK